MTDMIIYCLSALRGSHRDLDPAAGGGTVRKNLAAECRSHEKWQQLFLDGVSAVCRPSYSPQESQRQSCQSPISVHATLTDFPKHIFNLYPPSAVPSVIVTLGMSGFSLQRNRFSSRRLKRSPRTTETQTNYTTEH